MLELKNMELLLNIIPFQLYPNGHVGITYPLGQDKRHVSHVQIYEELQCIMHIFVLS